MSTRPSNHDASSDSGHTLFDSVQNIHEPNRAMWETEKATNEPASSDLDDDSRRGAEPCEDQTTLDDERMLKNETKAFELFEKRARDLKAVLDHLDTVARQLDHSHNIIQSIHCLEKTQNDAFKVFEKPSPKPSSENTNTQVMQVQSNNNDNEDDICKIFQDWASNIESFVKNIEQLPGHSEGNIAVQMRSHKLDLIYWASCLKTYQEARQINDSAVQKYIYYLGIETGEHMEKSKIAILHFIEKEMPLILQSQQAASSGFLTVSTLFCGVTATAIQFSYMQHSLLYTFANVAWIFSLGLSTAATIFALLKATWKETILRDELSVPRLVIVVIVEGAPLFFLVASIISFFLGLCAFTHAIDQGGTIILLTTLITGICAVGVIVDLLGFIRVHWQNGRKNSGRNDVKSVDLNANKFRDIENGPAPEKFPDNAKAHEFVPVLRVDDIREKKVDQEAIHTHEALVRQARHNKAHRNKFAKTSEMLASLCSRTRTLHVTTVSHMEFSPDGRFLATCSQDHTCLVLDAENLLAEKRVFGICKGHVRQITWSTQGKYILMRLQHNIMLWDAQPTSYVPQPGDMNSWKMTITRRSDIQQVLWIPNREAFLSVEGHKAIEFGINGKESNVHDLGCRSASGDVNSFVYSIAISSDEKYLICIVKLNKSPEGFKPSEDTRKEKQIIVYNMSIKRIECRVPIFHKVRHVSMSKDDFALIGYEGTHPPQLWRLIRPNKENTAARLVLSRTYLLKSGDDISISPCFGGTDEQLVICARKSGDVHIWDRGSAFLHKYIKPPSTEKNNDSPEVLSLAGNLNTKKLMLATGQHDGSIKVWAPTSTSTPQEEQETSQSGGESFTNSS